LKRQQQDAYDLVVLLLDTGARHTEIANLEWRQVDMEDQAIRLWRPKVENECILYTTERAFRVLSRRQSDTSGQYVFTNTAGKKRGYASDAIRKAFRRAGLPDCSINTLRHTHATRLIQNGMSIYEVKAILGHADIKTTMRYAHLEQRDVSSRARDVINKLNKKTEKPDLKLV
jgi:integrase